MLFRSGEVEAHVRQSGAADRISVEGYLTDDEKSEALAQSWVMLLPSLKEGWGLVVMEAAAHGVPTIALTEPAKPVSHNNDEFTACVVVTPPKSASAVARLAAPTTGCIGADTVTPVTPAALMTLRPSPAHARNCPAAGEGSAPEKLAEVLTGTESDRPSTSESCWMSMVARSSASLITEG